MARYRTMKHRLDYNTRPGYDYRGRILLRHTDPTLWTNPTMREFGIYLEKIINEMIYQIKMIKKARNYVVDQDDDDIN